MNERVRTVAIFHGVNLNEWIGTLIVSIGGIDAREDNAIDMY